MHLGNPAHAILEIARNARADLIVLGIQIIALGLIGISYGLAALVVILAVPLVSLLVASASLSGVTDIGGAIHALSLETRAE